MSAPVWEGLTRMSHFLQRPTHRIHLLQVKPSSVQENLPAVMMVHGVMSSGTTFYSKTGQGLAPFLARAGFNVFVCDLRGHGESTPSIKEKIDNDHGVRETVYQDIPDFHKAVLDISGQSSMSWVAHSLGGLWMSSSLARFPEIARKVDSQVYFGVKRTICGDYSLKHFFNIKFGWNGLCRLVAMQYGYLPAKRMKIGSDDDTIQYHLDTVEAIKCGAQWKLQNDDFDFALGSKKLIAEGLVPPTFHFCAVRDDVLGREVDVKRFAEESGQTHAFHMLSRKSGNSEDYDHSSMLVSKSCASDHFPLVSDWLHKHKFRTQSMK